MNAADRELKRASELTEALKTIGRITTLPITYRKQVDRILGVLENHGCAPVTATPTLPLAPAAPADNGQ